MGRPVVREAPGYLAEHIGSQRPMCKFSVGSYTEQLATLRPIGIKLLSYPPPMTNRKTSFKQTFAFSLAHSSLITLNAWIPSCLIETLIWS
ncbi:hypothetical protein NPIL_413661 [Nephila pilipes]|uniref:Uncharacterized protein n=1 Tax=Nephila pilipes TaxID=299642 RepID=A0A8X6TJU8_NEPPI|nr:hypothetical protein NPIL_413661 [Nephila pilipes]